MARRKLTAEQKKANADRMRARRAELRNDPKSHAIEREKERERYWKRKEAGKIKLVGDMSYKEKQDFRKMKRNHARKARAEKKKIPTPMEETRTDQRSRGRKKVKAGRSKLDRENKKLVIENKKLKRKVWKMEQREKRKKDKNDQLTPRSKVMKELQGKFVAPHVKKQLIFGAAVQEDLKTTGESIKSIKDKVTICNALKFNYLQKYKMMRNVNPLVFAKIRKRLKTKPLTEAYKRATSKARTSNLNLVHSFFNRDDVSAVSPGAGRKNYIKVGKIKKRKRILRGTLNDLYLKFCEENPESKKCSYETFRLLKPCNVVTAKMSDRKVCLCSVCENFKLLTQALNQSGCLQETSDQEVIRAVCCPEKKEECLQRSCKKCVNKNLRFQPVSKVKLVKRQKWVRVKEKKVGCETEVKRTMCKEYHEPVLKLQKEIRETLPKFLSHSFRDSHQQSVLRTLRSSLGPSDMLIYMDFSENYSCKYASEVQSAYYGASKQSVTLHQGIVYFENNEVRSFLTLSTSSRKDAAGIGAHLLPILGMHLNERPCVTVLHFVSDSPTTQYRNKETFFLTTQIIPALFPQIISVSQNLTEGGHGKSGGDGVGGWAKTEADRAVKNGKDISDISQMFTHLKEKSLKTDILIVTHEDILEMEKKIPKDLQTFHGTMKVHQVTWTKENRSDVYFNSVSCYQCNLGSECVHYGLPGCPWKPGRVNLEQPQEDEVDNPDPLPVPKRKNDKKIVSTGDWVAVKYNEHWYPGIIEKVMKVKVEVNFLVRHETSNELFLWPKKEDKQTLRKSEILYYLKTPPVAASRELFSIPERELIDNLM